MHQPESILENNMHKISECNKLVEKRDNARLHGKSAIVQEIVSWQYYQMVWAPTSIHPRELNA